MAEVNRQRLEIDLRTMGFEAAVRKHMFNLVEEVTVLRRELKEMAEITDKLIDQVMVMTQNTAGLGNMMKDFQRRRTRNDAIAEGKDEG